MTHNTGVSYKNFKHCTPIQLRFKDSDTMGHVNNANHFTYFELGRVTYFNEVVDRKNNWNRRGFILAKITVEYTKPLLLRDEVYVFTRCSRMGNKSFDLEHALVKKTNNVELMATGHGIIVCYDYEKNESILLPDEWREKMNAFEGA